MIRRCRVWVIVAVCVVIASAVAIGLSRSDSSDRSERNAQPGRGPAAVTKQPADSVPPRVSEPTVEPGSYEVDSTDLEFTDPELDDRTVSVTAWFPRAKATFPLVVFAHGFATGPETYSDFLAEVASRGYVVVAPHSFPTRTSSHTGPATGAPATATLTVARRIAAVVQDEPDPGLSSDEGPGVEAEPEPGDGGGSGLEPGDFEDDGGEGDGGADTDGDGGSGFDFEDQRLDMVATIDVVLGPDRPAELRGRVAKSPVGVIGHSDGGVTAAAVAFNSLAGDPRVGGAVIVSGSYGYFDGEWFPEGSPALLAIHGDSDSVNPFESSTAIYEADGGGPRYLVVAHGAGHIDLLLDDPPRTEISRLVTDFFTGYLRQDPAAAGTVVADANTEYLELLASG